MKRYINIPTIKRWDGKVNYKTAHYPEIPVSDSDIYVVSTETDYLDTLAYKYYRDPTMWFIIALANNIGNGRLSVEPGLQLRIPMNISKFMSDYKMENV